VDVEIEILKAVKFWPKSYDLTTLGLSVVKFTALGFPHSKNKTPFWVMLYLFWVCYVWSQKGGETYFGYLSRSAYVQPYHSKALGESFPYMWLAMSKNYQNTHYHCFNVIPKTGIAFPKRGLCFYCALWSHDLSACGYRHVYKHNLTKLTKPNGSPDGAHFLVIEMWAAPGLAIH